MTRLLRALLCAAIVIIWLCAMALIIDEKLSKQLDDVDITWEETIK